MRTHFLRDINFPAAARHLAFEVFSRSFFAEPAALSAAELATMFHIYFLGSSEGLIFDVANANFDVALWNPLRDLPDSRGVRIPHRRFGHRNQPRRHAFAVACDDGTDFECRRCGAGDRRGGLRSIVRQLPRARRRRLAARASTA